MILLILSAVGLLAVIGAAVLILGKQAKSFQISEAWKLALASFLFLLSKAFNDGDPYNLDPSVTIAKIGMFTFACSLVSWFLISVFRSRKRIA